MEDNTIPLTIVMQKNLKHLGVHFGENSKSPRVYVKELVHDGPIAKSGLIEKGDRIRMVNDKDVTGLSKRALKKLLSSYAVGTAVVLVLQCKDGYRINVDRNITDNDQLVVRRETVPITQNHFEKNKKNLALYKSTEVIQPPPRPLSPGVKRPPPNRVRNFITDDIHTDVLSKSAQPLMKCTQSACSGSLMAQAPRRPQGVRPREELLSQAEDFMKQYFKNSNRLDSDDHKMRWQEVQQTVAKTGTYDLTYDELVFASKTAWRNAPRCIGRIQWSKLKVFDARNAKTAKDMFEAICEHVEYATNNGNIRSAITVFPKRTDGEHDFRVWNAQFIKFAGYKQADGTVIGDPGSVEFTEICESMGWKGKGTPFDPMPLILQANGEDPELFELPEDLVLMVNLKHPKLDWFEGLGLKWYCVPAVANMCFDVGGLEFTGAPFNGWYMGTEIGARNICDPMRYNLLDKLGEKMGLDTSKNSSLWKDTVLVEVNIAVLHSFESAGVTIADHHTTSESFMKFLSDEFRLRGGCPADWVWVVPPMSGSLCPVFHQEMYNYVLKPSYEYQIDAWKTYIWRKDREAIKNGLIKQRRIIKLRELAWAVRFVSRFMTRALAARVKCTILYATETGKSETFAKKLNQIFQQAFNSNVVCMADYNMKDLQRESLVLVVTSTFGSGDPPDNGVTFANNLAKMVKESGLSRVKDGQGSIRLNISSLEGIRYSVFALGSKAYTSFCQFGRTVDEQLAALGSQQLLEVGEGDELSGQEKAFQTWAVSVFKSACDAYNITLDNDATKNLLESENTWFPGKYRLTEVEAPVSTSLTEKLKHVHKRTVHECILTSRKALQAPHSERETILVTFDCQNNEALKSYSPGDHMAIFPANRKELVDGVITRLSDAPSVDNVVRLESNSGADAESTNGIWQSDPKMPACSVREMFTRYLDITSPPSTNLMKQLAKCAGRPEERNILENLAADALLYEKWTSNYCPTICDVLKQFPSLQVPATLLISALPLLQVRYYSISSSSAAVPGQIHATVAVVKYSTQGNNADIRHGVCSSWLNDAAVGEKVPCYIRVAESFHLPKESKLPVILVGAGTGIAPYRGFIQQRKIEFGRSKEQSNFGPMTLYFGCRQSDLDNLYTDETQQAKQQGILNNVYTAFSRQPNQPKKYVQDLLWKNGKEVHAHIVKGQGHFYICGDSKMAGDVVAMLEIILCFYNQMTPEEAKGYIAQMKAASRYHEDIFGVSPRIKNLLTTKF